MNQVSAGKIQYFSSIDWLRFFAAFGIVWFHNQNSSWRSVGYAGLPVFLLVFCLLIVTHYDERKISEFVKTRAMRLLLPWVFWSFIYIIARFAKGAFIDKQSSFPFSLNTILVGGSLHLWYLPFSFLVALVFFAACRFTFVREGEGSHQRLLIASLLLATAASFCLSGYVSETYSVAVPFAQWLFALPSLPLGYMLGYIVRVTKPEIRLPLLVLVYAVVFGVCCSIYLLWGSGMLIPYGIGTVLTIAAIQYPFPFGNTAKRAGALAYGVYLIHPLVYSLVNMTLHIPFQFLKIVSVFMISLIVVYALKRGIFRFVL